LVSQNRRTAGSWPILGLLLALVLLAHGVLALAEEEPTISLVKNIVIREYKGKQVKAEVHVVRPGDTLIQLLSKRGVVNRLYLTRADRELLRTLNPQLKDLNLILPNRKILLPLAGAEPSKAEPPVVAPAPSSAPAPSPAAEEKTPEPAPDVPFRVHRVRRGETLSSILAAGGLTDPQAMLRYIEQVKKLNPNLKNVHWIYPNQRLKIPVLEQTVQAAQVEKPSPKPAAQIEKPEPAAEVQKPALPAPAAIKTAVPAPEAKEAKKTVASALTSPELPASETLARHAALGIIFTRMGERFISTGQHFLPLKSGDQITLKAATFPILKLRSGHRIILDLAHRLPDKMIELIRQQWTEYSIFQSRPGEDFRALLERLLKTCDYFRLIESGQAHTLDRPIRILLRADFIVFPSEADLAAGKAVLITLPAETRLGTYPEAAAYLAETGIRVIDFFPKGNLVGPSPWTPRDRAEESPVRQIEAEAVLDVLKATLDLLDLKYEANLSLPVTQKSQKDFELNVHASLYFNYRQTNYLVRFQPLSPQLAEALDKQAIRVVRINPDGDALDQAGALLRAMKLEAPRFLTLPASDRPIDQSPAFTFSGLVLPHGPERLFLTRTDIPEPLLELFDRARVTVVQIVPPKKTAP